MPTLTATDAKGAGVPRRVWLLVCLLIAQSVRAQPVTFTIDPNRKAQTIDNIGASGAWFSEPVGKFWPAEKKERMAELLFSKKMDQAGRPLGIGLSAWRFNIGGGTAEQGDSSGISTAVKRVECFLSPDGTYDWSKQAGYLWFTRKAATYGVENLIAFSNTPPVQFTRNGLGFRTAKDFETNLRRDRYGAYADFLGTVIRHFDAEGLHFDYVSPVNEPQWDWSNAFGKMNQEGSPWHNEDIFTITRTLDSTLQSQRLRTKILVPEAAILTAAYDGNGHASKQIQHFFDRHSPAYVANLKSVLPVFAGHSYFTDNGDTNLIHVRKQIRDTALKYKVPFWQSEYCLLGDGYREGTRGRPTAMDCALFLAKVIHHDLVIANARAWQFWNAWEPGNAAFNTRYYLIALTPDTNFRDGVFTPTKNLWALGHYSRFIRPGMQRLETRRSDGLTDLQAARQVMVSAFGDRSQYVAVAINYTDSTREIRLALPKRPKAKRVVQYITTGASEANMTPSPLPDLQHIMLPPRSISTIVIARK